MIQQLRTGDLRPASPLSPSYLSPADLAELLGVSRRTVYEWIDRGDVPHRRVGPRLIRFSPEDVEEIVGEPMRYGPAS